MRAHALLSASDAARWIACPPSARLTEHMDDEDSEFAREGTLAHAIAEVILSRELGILSDEIVNNSMEMLKSDSLYHPEMLGYIGEYVDVVLERYHSALAHTRDAQIIIEAKLDYSKHVPGGFGTGDAVIIADGKMEIIDLKYGKGLVVSAAANPQLRLYAAGGLAEYSFMYDINTIKTTIVQPRKDSISSEEMSVTELNNWLENIVEPAAKLAHAGEGEYSPGDKQCQWCKVKAGCKARKDHYMQLLAYGFKDANLMDMDEIGAVLTVASSLASWAKDIEVFVTDKLTAGEPVPGWKLVEGRSNRMITDEDKAIPILIDAAQGDESLVFKPKKLKGITDLEKHFGKKQLNTMLGSVIEKPPGKPVLASEGDPRPDINSVDRDFKNINFDE